MHVDQHDGKLTIVDDWTPDQDRPLLRQCHYPTGINIDGWEQLIGKRATRFGAGYYVGTDYLELSNGSNTLPIYSETKPIRKPRWRDGAFWFYGQWHRFPLPITKERTTCPRKS